MKSKKNKKPFSKDFLDKLTGYTAGYLLPDEFNRLQLLFENETQNRYFTFSSESNLLRIISAMYDKVHFLKECLVYPHYVSVLFSIAINSNYLTDVIVRNPEYLLWILNTNKLKTSLEKKQFQKELEKTINSFKTFEAKVRTIKSIKRKEVLSIGVKDILGLADLSSTVRELSILAECLTAKLFELCYQNVLSKYNIKTTSRKYAIVSLGKLGGRELNYSSDIDLIVFFDKNTKLNNKEYYEILTEAIHQFIKTASEPDESGYLYRIDFRLRPDGKNSPLCRTISDYLRYYETKGEDWERQMLIKANFLYGSKKLYDEFIQYLSPFIYPSAFLISPLQQIKKLRGAVLKSLINDRDIKQTSGGIRDIEFPVQALQLINGGNNKSLKTGNTQEAIKQLEAAAIITLEESKELSEAYIFYRKIEHYLQLMNDTQTHLLPGDGELAEKLACYLNFESVNSFNLFVTTLRQKVRDFYVSVIGSHDTDKENGVLSQISFNDIKKAEKNLLFLKKGEGLFEQKGFDTRAISLFSKIEAELFGYLKQCSSPDTVLTNFVRIMKQSKFPSIWYDEFSNKKLFSSFLKICEFSQKAIDLFAEDSFLRESFLSKSVFQKINPELENQLPVKQILFRLLYQFTSGEVPTLEVSSILSKFILLKTSLMIEKHVNNELNNLNYFAASLGSVAWEQASFNSDVDLIFVSENSGLYTDIQQKFFELINLIKKEIAPTGVDCRLRPEGRTSLMIWDIEKYEQYLEKRIRTWELQALCKIKFVSGNKKLFEKFVVLVRKKIEREDKTKLKKEIKEMREKLSAQSEILPGTGFNIKKGRGGLSDMDFILQFLILSNHNFYNLCIGKKFFNVLKQLEKQSVDFGKDYDRFADNYLFLKNLELTLQNTLNLSSPMLPVDESKLRKVFRAMNFNNRTSFEKRLNDVIKSNIQLFNKYLS
jgi:glutamate-ammonia-ligase adenylyltransferase